MCGKGVCVCVYIKGHTSICMGKNAVNLQCFISPLKTIWVTLPGQGYSSCESGTAHSYSNMCIMSKQWYWCVQHFHMSKQWYGCVQYFHMSKQWYGCVQYFHMSKQWYGCVQYFYMSKQWYGCVQYFHMSKQRYGCVQYFYMSKQRYWCVQYFHMSKQWYGCVQYFYMSKQWYGCQRLGLLVCPRIRMLMGGCMDTTNWTIPESWFLQGCDPDFPWRNPNWDDMNAPSQIKNKRQWNKQLPWCMIVKQLF